jgi:hypothetical protein
MTASVQEGARRRAKAALVAAGLAVMTTVATVGSAHAIPPQSAPWCANMGGGWGFDCSYFTFEQCMATARGLGNYCSPNPNAIVPPRTTVRKRGRYYVDEWGRRVRVR